MTPDAKHPMASADAAWLRMDSPTNLMVVNSVLWFEQPVDWERLTSVLEERIVNVFPRFRQIAVEPGGGRAPYWQDYADFDPHLNLHHVALPAPGDDAALRELVSDLMSQPLDRTKPLWQTYLIDNYRDGAAMLSRLHHAMADGIALARVMMLMTDGEPDAAAPGVPFARRGRERSRARAVAHAARVGTQALAHESFETLIHPRHLGELAGAAAHELVDDARALYKDVASGADADTILRRGPLGPENRVAWSDTLSLAEVKAIGRRYDATVNDVLVAAVAGAIARYLKAHDSSAPGLRAMIPFNLRPLDEPIDPNLGNQFALVLLELPTGPATPLQRLRATKQKMDAIKRSREPAVSMGILAFMGQLPSQFEELMIGMFTNESSLVLTNVPGPREPVYVAGTEVAGVLPFAPCAGKLGMTATIFSYAGGVRVGFVTDARRIPDPEALTRAFASELRALRPRRRPRTAAQTARRSGRTRPHA